MDSQHKAATTLGARYFATDARGPASRRSTADDQDVLLVPVAAVGTARSPIFGSTCAADVRFTATRGPAGLSTCQNQFNEVPALNTPLRFGIWALVHGSRAALQDPDEPYDASWERNRDVTNFPDAF
jgi:hypothetical protein